MNIEEFFNDINGKTIAFCGIGRSNLPVMELFHKKGAKIVARDKNTALADPNSSDAAKILEKINAKLILGENYLDNLNEYMVLRTPGIPYTFPEFQKAVKNGVNVTSEMEIFFELCPCKIYAVTGSDGKTTTTSMIAEILKNNEDRVYIGGNIGRPLLPLIEDMTEYDVAVVELSSFQLMSMTKSPDVAVITNLSPNHLDVHKDMDEYIDAKRNVYMHQSTSSKTILNMDNSITKTFVNDIKGEVLGFSSETEITKGAYAKDGCIYINGEFLMKASDMKLQGKHNVENFMAAICAVYDDVSADSIFAVAKTFGGVAHRAEFVREFEGVKYYNDSIASSPTRTIKGTLSMYDRKIILIVGGADKGVSFDELGKVICERSKVLIVVKPKEKLFGFKDSAGDKISNAVLKYRYFYDGVILVIRVTNMNDAVKAAREVAQKGDIVSLSPACTSFDMYKDFEARGNHYKEIVTELR